MNKTAPCRWPLHGHRQYKAYWVIRERRMKKIDYRICTLPDLTPER
ncbi:hypothetical protein GIX45_15050 [Erwinia sp. CPCC 100877]|nr:hypothetical protein [Erwinia sp. CPCC 100877]